MPRLVHDAAPDVLTGPADISGRRDFPGLADATPASPRLSPHTTPAVRAAGGRTVPDPEARLPADPPDVHRLLAYVADLELEVDRLRKHGGFVRHAVAGGLRALSALANSPADGADLRTTVAASVRELAFVLRDLHDPPGYHPADDQVVPIAVRPLVELVFGWQRRLTAHPEVELRLELGVDHMDWFPARLRHILDNLFSNALRYRDPVKAESWVCLRLTPTAAAYELRLSDNGMGLPAAERLAVGPLTRAAPLRDAGVAVGLPVVRLLVEQSGGTLTVRSDEGRGTDFVLTLPRYDLTDFLV